MTVSQLAGRPARQPRLYRLESEPDVALGRTARTWPHTMAGGWIRQWSGDQLTKFESPGQENCMDQTGAVCPKFAEVRARQVLAERQLVEFNHRLVNMLQVLVGRIDRQRRMQDDPTKMDELQSLMTSVRASAQLHRYLHPPRTQTHVDLGSLVANVAAAIEDVTGLLCDVDAEAVTVPSPIAVHLAAAVNELAWNAYKHAYRGAEGGKIRIVYRRDDDGRLRLSVADHGGGLPPDFDPRVSEGLGFLVVCATARQFDGELRAESDDGARFTLLLNIPRVD